MNLSQNDRKITPLTIFLWRLFAISLAANSFSSILWIFSNSETSGNVKSPELKFLVALQGLVHLAGGSDEDRGAAPAVLFSVNEILNKFLFLLSFINRNYC